MLKYTSNDLQSLETIFEKQPSLHLCKYYCFSALFELQISLRKTLSLSLPNLKKTFLNMFDFRKKILFCAITYFQHTRCEVQKINFLWSWASWARVKCLALHQHQLI